MNIAPDRPAQGIRVTAGEGEDGRDNHETGHDRDRGIKDLNILGGIFDRKYLFQQEPKVIRFMAMDRSRTSVPGGYHRHP